MDKKIVTVVACALIDVDGRVLLAKRPAPKKVVRLFVRVSTSTMAV